MLGIFNPKKEQQSAESNEAEVNTEVETQDVAGTDAEVVKPHGSGHCCGGCGGE